MSLFLTIFLLVLVGLLALLSLSVMDRRADNAEWQKLRSLQPQIPSVFDWSMVAELPEPARRYFAFTIKPGTPILPIAEIEMRGEFGLGTKDAPNYQPMEARQILATPHGFVWAMRLLGKMPVSGSDSGRWTRFRVLGMVPVARLGGYADHARSAFGRHVAEAVFWTPAALLPGTGVTWCAVDEDTARVIVRYGVLEQSVDVTVDSDGRPVKVAFQRWSNANPEKSYRLQPFGGLMSDFREVDGYRLPFRVEAGNMFETDDYFPFFLAEVTAIRFPKGF